MKNTLKSGFTLVELLVVVLIIGILSSVALPQYTKAVKKAKGVKLTTAAGALAKAMNMAYLEDGSYRRSYGMYNGVVTYSDDFDIEVPAVSMNAAGDWWISTGSGGYSTSIISVGHSGSSSDNFDLVYHLSNGKLNSITCSGPGCSQYFPGSMLSGN